MLTILSRRPRRALVGALLFAGLGSGLACSDRVTRPDVGGRAPVTVSAALTPAQQAIIAGMSVEVTGPGITTPIIVTLNVAGGTVNGTVEVPVGNSRTFTVRAYDAQGTETHVGSATANVVAGTNPTLTVSLLAHDGNVPINVMVGSYAVTLTPSSATVAVNGEVTLTAGVTVAGGGTASGPLTWGVLNPALVTLTVAQDGRSAVVRGRLAGSTRVVASYEGIAAASEITVTAATSENQPPVANANGPYSGTAGVAMTFSSAGSTDPDGVILRREWLFGDGTGSDVANPTKTYTTAGTYTVTLRVVDDDNAATTVTTTATIAPPPNQRPTVQLQTTQYITYVRQILTVLAFGSDADGTVVQYRWQFSDTPGIVHTTTVGSFSRQFELPGTYSVSVVAVDDKGEVSQSRSASIIVNAIASP